MPTFCIHYDQDITRYNTLRCHVNIEAPCEAQARTDFENGNYPIGDIHEDDEDYLDSERGDQHIREVERIHRTLHVVLDAPRSSYLMTPNLPQTPIEGTTNVVIPPVSVRPDDVEPNIPEETG